MNLRSNLALLHAAAPVLLGAALAAADANESWHNWRGPAGTGVASSAAPTHWSDTENVSWQVDIPGRGFSTPIVVGDRMYLTTAVPTGSTETPPAAQEQDAAPRGRGRGREQTPREEQSFNVMCINRHSGEQLWSKTATVATPHEGYHRTYGSYASYSPISDGGRVYASFGSYGIYCYDLEGTLQWSFDPGVKLSTRNQFGEGAAPAMHGDNLIQLLDQEGQSQIVVLNKHTGEVNWKKERDEPTTWAMPLITEVNGRMEVITTGTNRVRSYDLETGDLIWECGGLGTNPIPRPVRFEDTVLVMSGHRSPNLMSIRLGREGDLTGTDAVVWSTTQGTAYTCAPVLDGDKFYVLTDRGELSCFNAATGEAHYRQERLPRGTLVKASPIAADGKLYIADESGRVHILGMGPAFEVVATNALTGQFFVSSPIVVDGDLYLRSRDRLYCISND